MHAGNLFTSNKHFHWPAIPCGAYTKWGCSSNYHSDVIVCSTPETSLNDFSLWCIGSCVACYWIPRPSVSSELHPHRCHTLRWYCCAPGHSSSRCWTIHTLSTHSNSGEWKLSSYIHNSEEIHITFACNKPCKYSYLRESMSAPQLVYSCSCQAPTRQSESPTTLGCKHSASTTLARSPTNYGTDPELSTADYAMIIRPIGNELGIPTPPTIN